MALLEQSGLATAARRRISTSSADGHYPHFVEFGHPALKRLDLGQPRPRV